MHTPSSQPSLRPGLSHWSLLTADEMEKVRQAAVRYLTTRGYTIQNRDILQALEKKGAKVDYPRMHVLPGEQMIRGLEDAARRHPPGAPPEDLLRRRLPTGAFVGHNYTCYFDWTERRTRPAALDDLRKVAKAWHMIPQITSMNTCMTAQDVPAAIEPIVSAAELMKLSTKLTGGPEMMLAGQLPFLEDLESLMKGKPVRHHDNGCSVTRFTVDERAADVLMAVHRRNGVQFWWVNSTPIAGASAPVTLAGTLTVGVAEVIGGWLAAWALNEDVTLWAIPLAGMMDMRTGRVLFSTPETIVVDSAMYQFFHHFYGMKIGLCPGYTDAKVPGLQAFNDKLMKALAYGWFTDITAGQSGALNAGKTYSPTQQIIDLELNRQTDQLSRGITVTDETINLADIQELAAAFDSSFLDTDHTLAHYRDELWSPSLLDRTPFTSDQEELRKDCQIIEKAEQCWRDALASYEPPPLSPDRLRDLDQIIAAAKRLLL